MKIKLFLPAALALLSSAAAAVDQDRFAWRYDLPESPAGPVLRVVLGAQPMADLHRDDARDWQVVDARGRPVPAILLPAEALTATATSMTELAFEQTIIDDTSAAIPPLSLDIERGLTRVLIQAPDRRARPDDGRLVFQALIAAPDQASLAEQAWLHLHLQADQRVRLDCRFGDAEADHAGIDRFAFEEVGDARPRRYQGREPVASIPSAWHLSCFASQPVPGLSLVRAALAEAVRVDHRRSELVEPLQTSLEDEGAVVAFQLSGPFNVNALSFSSELPGLFSQLRVQSRAGLDQPWRDRARLSLSTLNDEADAVTVLPETVRQPHWRAHATPPLPQAPQIAVQVLVDEIAFLAQGEGPWQLQIGSIQPGDGHMLPGVLTDLSERQGPAWDWPVVALGERRELAGLTALSPPKDPTPWQRYLLWAILAGACLVVLTLALRLLRGD